MSFNPELWFDENKQGMPANLVDTIEKKRMFLRGWFLYNKICNPLDHTMIAHACSKIDDPHKIPLLNDTLRLCAHFYILTVCTDVEAILRNNQMNYATDFIDKNMEQKNKHMDTLLHHPDLKPTLELLEETVEILQKPFLDYKPGLLEIDSKWWVFYKHAFQLHGMHWQADAFEIVQQLRNGKKPEELIHLTHQKEYNAVQKLVDLLKNFDAGSNQ